MTARPTTGTLPVANIGAAMGLPSYPVKEGDVTPVPLNGAKAMIWSTILNTPLVWDSNCWAKIITMTHQRMILQPGDTIDADTIELSSRPGNALIVMPDGLFLSAPTLDQFNTEISNRAAAIATEAANRDKAIGDAITQEVTDRNTAISSAISAGVANRNAAISAAIASEVTNRDAAIATAINKEVTDRNTAVTSSIATEITNRNTAINTAIAGEVVNRNTAIAGATAQEVSDRNAAITSAINTEATNRNTAINTAINAEAANRNTAISGAIATEVTNRDAAVAAAIAALKGGVASDGDTLAKLRALIASIQTVLQSNDATLDTIQELVTRIKSDEGLISSLTTGKVNVADVVNALTSTATDRPLSAAQGKILSDRLDAEVAARQAGDTNTLAAIKTEQRGKNQIFWYPGTFMDGAGFNVIASGSGSIRTKPSRTAANRVTQLERVSYTTGTSATGVCGQISESPLAWRGNADGLGGFMFFCRFALEAYTSTEQFMVGLSALAGVLTGNPSLVNNTFAIGKDSTDATIQVISRSATAVTKVNTGITPSTTQVLEVTFFCDPNSDHVDVDITDSVTKAQLFSTTITTNLPVNTAFMYLHTQIRSTAGTTAKILSVNNILLESEI